MYSFTAILLQISHTQLYSPFEKAAQLYAKENESEHLTNQHIAVILQCVYSVSQRKPDRYD